MKQWLLEHDKEKYFLKTMEYSWIATCQLVTKITVAQNSRPKISGVQIIWPNNVVKHECGQFVPAKYSIFSNFRILSEKSQC